MRTRTLLALLTCSLLALPACFLGLSERPYFDRNHALSFFEQHQAAFEAAAQDWSQHHPGDSFHFNRREDKRFYWNTAGLACGETDCRVRTGDGHETGAMPFADAAKMVGTRPCDLRHWMKTAKRLNLDGISAIGTALPVYQRYLEFRLRGSSHGAYGFLYIPSGHTGALRLLVQSDAAAESGFTYLQPINANWAYFESRS